MEVWIMWFHCNFIIIKAQQYYSYSKIINESIFSEIFISAWVSSLALSLTMFAAPVMGHLSEKFGCRLVTLVGMLSGIVGLVAT